MPSAGLGCWKLTGDVPDLVHKAIKAGWRHLDCACDYGNEAEVGEGIARAIADGTVTREELWVTSKLWNTYHRPEHVEAACRKSLSDLKLDYLDLYLIHFPISLKYVPFETRYPPEWVHDPAAEGGGEMVEDPVPVAATWGAMEALVEAKLVREIGVANFASGLLTDLLASAKSVPPAVLQIESHPYLTQERLISFARARGVAVTAFSPLGSSSYVELSMDGGEGAGVLTQPAVVAIAEAVGRSPAQVVLRWNVQRGVAVIPKTSNPARLAENLALFDFELSSEQMATLSALNANKRYNDPGVFAVGMGGDTPIFD